MGAAGRIEPRKAFVEIHNDRRGRQLDVFQYDGRLRCLISRVLAPFLQKVRITLRFLDDAFQTSFSTVTPSSVAGLVIASRAI